MNEGMPCWDKISVVVVVSERVKVGTRVEMDVGLVIEAVVEEVPVMLGGLNVP